MKEPDYTCPTIDRTQAEIEELMEAVHNAASATTKSIIAELEVVRECNSELRDWGQYWEATAKEFETRVNELEDEVDTLQDELKDLTEEHNQLLTELKEKEVEESAQQARLTELNTVVADLMAELTILLKRATA
jgi:chromosome segregation ATPase